VAEAAKGVSPTESAALDTTRAALGSSWPAASPTLLVMPDWAPPLLAAGSAIVVLNVAHAVMRFRQRYGLWAVRTLLELRRWDGRL